MGPRTDPRHVHDMGLAGNSRHHCLDFFRSAARFWLDGFFLAWRDPAGLHSAHAMLRQQPHAPGARRRWQGLQHERVVAWAFPNHRMGRELAPEPSLACRVRASWFALVANGYRLVFHLDAGTVGSGAQCEAPARFLVPGLLGPAQKGTHRDVKMVECTRRNSK